MDKATYDRQNGFLKTVAEHLKAQGGPALSDEGNCVYRNAEGLKCAVGALIPDALYNPGCEGSTLMRFVGYPFGVPSATLRKKEETLLDTLLAAGVHMDDLELLNALQEIHDGADPVVLNGPWWEHVALKLDALAKKAGLDPKVIPAQYRMGE